MSISGAEQSASMPVGPQRRPSLDEQAKVRGTRPIESADTYAVDGAWESDQEVEEFIRHTYAARRENA